MSLVTQFSVPALPPGFVERPRLRLELPEPLTLVCAPAGSGKTALMASSLPEAAWVSLESADDEPGRLWTAVLCALEAAGAVDADSALAALGTAVPDPGGPFMTRLVNALAELPERVVLVLDDVHVLRSRECLEQLGFLAAHVPGEFRLVIAARSDPRIPLHVLRVRGRLGEVRARDLAFTEEEAHELLRAHGLDLPNHLVKALHARTEGWSAGLRLAALSLQGREDPERFVAEFAGDDRVIGEYLLAEVLDRQPPRLRAFLLATSLVDRVCGSLADALTRRTDGAETLDQLERVNGFVLGLDGRREWFRYHRLFATLLRAQAQRELGARTIDLHARAARWYAQHGALVEALEHAVAAEEWDLAVDVVADHWFDVYVRGDALAVRALIAKLPPDRLAGEAELAAALGFFFNDTATTEMAAVHLAHAEAAAAELPEPRRRRYRETMTLADLGRARLDGDFERARRAADELLGASASHSGDPDGGAREALVRAMLGEAALWGHHPDRAGEELGRAVTLARVHGLDYVAVAALGHLALLDVLRHGPSDERGHGEEAIALAARRGWSLIPQTACAHTALALEAFYDVRPDDAAEHLAAAVAAPARVSHRRLAFVIAQVSAQLAGANGTPGDGLRVLSEFEARHGREGETPDEWASVAALRARLLLASGLLDEAEAAIAPARGKLWPAVALADAQLQLARGRAAEAAEELAAIEAEAADDVVVGVERAVLQAVACDDAGDPAAAARALEHALALAEITHHRRPFLDWGRRVDRLLRQQIRTGTAHRAIVAELLDRFADRAPTARSVAPLLEPLSDREQAILRYLPTGLSNREIAAELFVTTNTVKTHLRSIYRKLDVARRREAVDRARELRLISNGGVWR